MNSMTGFGSSRYRGRGLELDVHVKSVNGRFLEVRLHLPKEFAPFENELRREFRSWDRGTVDVFVQRRPSPRGRAKPSVRVNETNARHWAKQLRELSRSLGFANEVTLQDVLQMPQVLETEEALVDAAGEMRFVVKTTRAAVAACTKVRKSEGVRLKRELLSQLGQLETLVKKVSAKETSARRTTADKIGARVASLGGESLDPERLAVETALVMEKADVREEMVRLREHVRACRAVLAAQGARGKKLDFYGQELLREVNTVGSKSPGADVTNIVVQAKSVIEKFREQVQNIE